VKEFLEIDGVEEEIDEIDGGAGSSGTKQIPPLHHLLSYFLLHPLLSSPILTFSHYNKNIAFFITHLINLNL